MKAFFFCILFNFFFVFLLSSSFNYSLFHSFFDSFLSYLNITLSSYFHLYIIAFLSIFIQLISFLYASGILFKNQPTEKYFDLTGSFTYLILIFYSLYNRGEIINISRRQGFLALFVIIWAIRLGSFLFNRIKRHNGIDNRFNEIKNNFNRFSRAWAIQGIWVFLTALPVFLVLNFNDQGTKEFNLIDCIGITLWIVGFSFECLADYQKSIWKQKNTFINTGLWSISRHPNC